MTFWQLSGAASSRKEMVLLAFQLSGQVTSVSALTLTSELECFGGMAICNQCGCPAGQSREWRARPAVAVASRRSLWKAAQNWNTTALQAAEHCNVNLPGEERM